ncbi:MAG TPA: tetratricopeptide repeat protein [Kofleriaceae bacterium]|nr:tetratricopeptide repeat protein [Kofleriaceae bacterium]
MQTRTDGLVEPWRGELRRGLERLRRGEYGAAEAHFARAHRLAPDRAEVAFALGRERLRQGDLDQAEQLLTAAWRRDPTLLSAGAFLARCVGLERRDHARAHAILDEARAHHGPAPLLAVVEAEILLDEGRVDEARRLAEEVAGSPAPDAAQAAARALLARVHNHEGLARVEAGEPESALFAFRRAADLDPEWSAPHSNLGAAFEALGRDDRARAAYQRALAIDPDSQTALYNLARLLRRQGEGRAALDLIEPAATAGGADPDLLVLLAELHAEAGARGPAEECLRRALAVAPQHGAAKLHLADLLMRDGRYIEAAQLAREAQAAGRPPR